MKLTKIRTKHKKKKFTRRKNILLGPLHSICQIPSHEYDIKQYGMDIALSFSLPIALEIKKNIWKLGFWIWFI